MNDIIEYLLDFFGSLLGQTQREMRGHDVKLVFFVKRERLAGMAVVEGEVSGVG